MTVVVEGILVCNFGQLGIGWNYQFGERGRGMYEKGAKRMRGKEGEGLGTKSRPNRTFPQFTICNRDMKS